jgi:monoamine oxidase
MSDSGSTISADVVVIGAGAAGLIAARMLARAGLAVELLEARSRVGGRILTLPDAGGHPIELGAEFVHGRPKATLRLLEEAGSSIVPGPASHWSLRDGKLAPAEDVLQGVQQLVRQAEAVGEESSVAMFLSRFAGNESLRPAVEWARMMVEGFDAADPARASLKAIVEEWTGSEGAQRRPGRPAGGYGRLMETLADSVRSAGVRLRINTVVQAVSWKEDEVIVDASAERAPYRVRARRAVATLPVGVLQAAPGQPGAVRFSPGLESKQNALDHLIMGPVLRVVLTFREPFWETIAAGRYRDVAFFHAPGLEIPTFWTALPDRVPTLTAWVGGPSAGRLSEADDAEIVRTAVHCGETLFGAEARIQQHLIDAHLHNWQRDPFARGAYSYLAVGGLGARTALAGPLANTLFFAGEATSEQESGTVGGALAAGEAAAQAVLASLEKRAD